MALVNDLTPHQSERIALNSYRQAATMAANVVMFLITYVLLRNTGDEGEGKESMTIQEEDLVVFTVIYFTILLVVSQ